MSKILSQFSPELHEITEVIDFLPGDHLVITIDAHSLGSVFICKCKTVDPVVSYKKSEQ